MDRLVDVLNRPEPTMAATFTEPMDDNVIRKIAAVADVAEFRADKYSSTAPDYLSEQARKLAALPLLLTIRIEAEGGGWAGTEEDRLSLFSILLPQSDGVDIEVEADIFPDVIEAAHKQDKVVVASSHDFNATPTEERLEDMLAQAIEASADYIKFAASAKTIEDYQRLAEFTLRYQDEGLIVVAMDDYGPLSRITLPGLGSRLTYAFTGTEPVALGQLGYEETHELLKKFYPDYKKLFE